MKGDEPMDLLTMPEVSAALHVPIDTLRYWRQTSQGPTAFRVGRRVMYDRAEVERWLDEQRRASAAQR